MADDKDKATPDLHIGAVQLVLCAVFGLLGAVLFPELSGLGRVAFILAMFQAGAGVGALVAAHHRDDSLGYVPA
ncbi:hypothetical protein [uncultured Tessaracoccus sp.]|uniref:hypothetical protein n=1 Tax=uncultured Tessaracoccus sp. TaxID=905023 RepID=UPI0026045ABB|nr:hypothetical protein [uncultured Tessaracoccus sp.]